MSFKIISDSASNLLEFSGVDFTSVPLKIVSGTNEYIDNAELDVAKMVEQLAESRQKSCTSCPNFQDWLDAFGDSAEIFAVTITGALSGSYSAAVQAREEYIKEHPAAKVCVIDTRSAGPEMQLILEKLREFSISGVSFEEAERRIKDYIKGTHLFFSLQSLTNLARNGRVNPAVAKLAGVLGIRIVGFADDGTLAPAHKCRGEKRALDTIKNEMKKLGFKGGKVRISHCFNPESAKELKEMILAEFAQSDIDILPCTALCSFYAEKGGLLVGFES